MTHDAIFWFGLGDFIITVLEIAVIVGIFAVLIAAYDKDMLKYKWISRLYYGLFPEELYEDVEGLED